MLYFLLGCQFISPIYSFAIFVDIFHCHGTLAGIDLDGDIFWFVIVDPEVDSIADNIGDLVFQEFSLIGGPADLETLLIVVAVRVDPGAVGTVIGALYVYITEEPGPVARMSKRTVPEILVFVWPGDSCIGNADGIVSGRKERVWRLRFPFPLMLDLYLLDSPGLYFSFALLFSNVPPKAVEKKTIEMLAVQVSSIG